jgi:group I intron endonuclease
MVNIWESAAKPKTLMYTIYKITNKIDGMSYIGVTRRDLKVRLKEHCGLNHGYRTKLGSAIVAHGIDSFTIDPLAKATSVDEAKELEKSYIERFDTRKNGYNVRAGGEGGFIISEHTRAAMALAKIGDSRCADNFGPHTNKGAKNPRAKSYRVEYPDGSIHVISGARAFCREHDVSFCKLFTKGKSKGYKVLGRFIDQSLGSYTQAGGNGEYPQVCG